VSTATTWGIHQISFDASAGTTRYLNYANLDTYQYAVHASDAWAVSRCSGALSGAESRSTSVLGEFVGSGGINNVTSTTFNQTTKCSIAGNYSANFNAGYSRTTNSEAINSNGSTSLVNSVTPTNLNQLNNSQSVYVAAGITYSLTQTDTLQGLLTVTGYHYPNRQNLAQLTGIDVNALGLSNNTTQDSFNLTYTRQLQPDLSLVASLGAAGSKDEPFGAEWPSRIQPQYSVSLNWSATPKLSFNATASRSSDVSTSVIANTQLTESATLGMSYQITPKLGFSAGASVSYASSANTPNASSAATQALVNYLTRQDTYSAHAGLSYTVTPFIGANLNYSYSRVVQPGATVATTTNARTNQSTLLFSLNYNPH
jgi:hypothetical protein